MNVEENRLQTFQTWPDNAPVEPRQLAREGFFATGNFLETECNWCHKRTNDWQYGDNIRRRHSELDPLCMFLTNPNISENVPQHSTSTSGSFEPTEQQQPPTSSTVQQTTTDISQLDLKIEANRLATFANWPNPNITPQSLAKAGFYYFNYSDQVRCAWCKGVIAEWEKQDNAFVEHQRFFPDCPRMQLGPLIEIASDGIRDLGIQQISTPKCPKYSSLDARQRTFTNWPISDIQRPEALAQAGLYYHDKDDEVHCFHCNMGLRLWQKEDDPWFEHAKWYPHCQFVRLVKGPQYVQQVQQLARQSAAQLVTSSCEELATDMCPTVSSASIEEAMCSAPVLQALQIGIDVGSIRTVTQRRLEISGRPYDTVENLLKAVFDDPDDSDSDDFASNMLDNESEGAFASYMHDGGRSHRTQADADASLNMASSSTRAFTQTHSVSPINLPSTHVHNMSLTSENALDDASAAICHENTPSLPGLLSDSVQVAKTPLTATTDTICKLNQSHPERKISLEEENRKLKDARLCKVCLDDEVGVVFLPCGHLVTCVQCAPGVNQCPMCRTPIKGFVRTFLS